MSTLPSPSLKESLEEPPIFLCVAGEVSGDLLGGGLIEAIKQHYPEAQFIGIGGERMQANGLKSYVAMEKLSIMGLIEVLKHLPELLSIKKQLITIAKQKKITAYIGIDAPDFNLRVAKSMKKMSIPTFQYVSPSIWVWRESRAHGIKKAIDRVLCLLPFEPALYRKYDIDAVFVGHPMADEIPLQSRQSEARAALGLTEDSQILAVLPGSRHSEVHRLMPIFLECMTMLNEKYPDMHFVLPAATPDLFVLLQEMLQATAVTNYQIIQGQSRMAMSASDAVLLASGTASLEAALLKKPQVVCYKFSNFTAWLAPKIVKIPYFALPNILAQKEMVPECFQNEVNHTNLLPLIEEMFQESTKQKLLNDFSTMHHQLKNNANQTAAASILEYLCNK